MAFCIQLYRLTKAAGMNVPDVIKLLTITNNDLPSVQHRYEEPKKEVFCPACRTKCPINHRQSNDGGYI